MPNNTVFNFQNHYPHSHPVQRERKPVLGRIFMVLRTPPSTLGPEQDGKKYLYREDDPDIEHMGNARLDRDIGASFPKLGVRPRFEYTPFRIFRYSFL